MATAYVNNIEWESVIDNDPDAIEKDYLPSCFEFEFDKNDFIDEDAISDWITDQLNDQTGWCVSGFDYFIKPTVKLIYSCNQI